MNHNIPQLLHELIERKVWPADSRAAMAQNLHALVSPERVQVFAPEEDRIHLNPPPFKTIAELLAAASSGALEGFWNRFGALDQIVAEKAVVIGDFGPGSDAPIILDFSRDALDPPVLRLRYGPDGRTDWVQGAQSFAEFAAKLGLATG